MSTFVSLSSAYQNTRDGGAHQGRYWSGAESPTVVVALWLVSDRFSSGVKIQVNSNSVWNSNTQLQRTELVAVLPSDAKTGNKQHHYITSTSQLPQTQLIQ